MRALVVLELLERLIRCLEVAFGKQDRKTLALLDLPPEVLQLMLNALPLHTKLLLAQTCRSMRSMLEHDIMYAATPTLSTRRRFALISGLADASNDHVACGSCYMAHRIDALDLPYPPFPTNNLACSSTRAQLASHNYGIRYRLTYQHVQLALKYTRRRQSNLPVPDDYLAALLQPCISHAVVRKTVDIAHMAHPKVIHGRFILHTQWQFWIPGSAVFMEDIRPSLVCPHLNLTLPCCSLVLSNAMNFTLRDAQISMGKETFSACRRCATDYSITFRLSGVTIKVWQDLGSTGSPHDPYWKAATDEYGNSPFRGPIVPHEPQSVRDHWLQQESRNGNQEPPEFKEI